MTVKVWSYLVDLIAPARCPFCDRFIKWDKLFCLSCLMKLPFTGDEVCNTCGKAKCVCESISIDGDEVKEYPHYDKCVVPLYYDEMVKHLVIDMKYNHCGVNCKTVAEIITRRLKKADCGDSLLISVPMSRRGMIARGYNQSHLIAKNLSSYLEIEYEPNVLKKNRKTKDQKELSKKERMINLLDAFTVVKPDKVIGRNILLCDDVLTSGNTLSECAKTLKLAGAGTITAVAFATVKADEDNTT